MQTSHPHPNETRACPPTRTSTYPQAYRDTWKKAVGYNVISLCFWYFLFNLAHTAIVMLSYWAVIKCIIGLSTWATLLWCYDVSWFDLHCCSWFVHLFIEQKSLSDHMLRLSDQGLVINWCIRSLTATLLWFVVILVWRGTVEIIKTITTSTEMQSQINSNAGWRYISTSWWYTPGNVWIEIIWALKLQIIIFYRKVVHKLFFSNVPLKDIFKAK